MPECLTATRFPSPCRAEFFLRVVVDASAVPWPARGYPLKITSTTARTATKASTASRNSAGMPTIMATWADVAYDHVLAFGLGVVVGFVLANRYRLTRRKDDEP